MSQSKMRNFLRMSGLVTEDKIRQLQKTTQELTDELSEEGFTEVEITEFLEYIVGQQVYEHLED